MNYKEWAEECYPPEIKAIKRVLEDRNILFNTNYFLSLGFSNEETETILRRAKENMEKFFVGILRDYEALDQCFDFFGMREFDVIVPINYNHKNYLNEEWIVKMKTYWNGYMDKFSTDSATELLPGKKYKARIYPILKTMSTDVVSAFLERRRAISVGYQGLMMSLEQHADKFPTYKKIFSFDQFTKNTNDDHWIPYVSVRGVGDHQVDLWPVSSSISNIDRCILIFTEV